jgi:hypothetical protein
LSTGLIDHCAYPLFDRNLKHSKAGKLPYSEDGFDASQESLLAGDSIRVRTIHFVHQNPEFFVRGSAEYGLPGLIRGASPSNFNVPALTQRQPEHRSNLAELIFRQLHLRAELAYVETVYLILNRCRSGGIVRTT